eukprot:GFUD01019398.1.p1 GENE.GFUD01019398.1~~GFUD01019398.1.p1  ORF type:complete len:366 (-),score=109.30 GFUD01019398.1:56-1078(-)
MVKASVGSFYNNYNLLGLDIFIDTDLKPYLLEVNTIPSLFINQISKEIDLRLKAPLIAETLNICGHHISTGVGARHKADIVKNDLPGYTGKTVGYDHRMYCKGRSEAEEVKQGKYCTNVKDVNGENGVDEVVEDINVKNNVDQVDQDVNGENSVDETVKHVNGENGVDEVVEDVNGESGVDEGVEEEDELDEIDSEYESDYEWTDGSETTDEKSIEDPSPAHTQPQPDILKDLTPCDVRVLIASEEELTQTETFERIFPRPDTSHYLQYMSSTNYYDLLLSAWESRYAECREEGRQRLRELTEQRIHLQVPEAEKKIKIPRRSPKLFKKNNFNIPHIFKK